jgi:hypothetical protein
MSGVTKEVIGWFDVYKDLVTYLHIQEHNMYNMNETEKGGQAIYMELSG